MLRAMYIVCIVCMCVCYFFCQVRCDVFSRCSIELPFWLTVSPGIQIPRARHLCTIAQSQSGETLAFNRERRVFLRQFVVDQHQGTRVPARSTDPQCKVCTESVVASVPVPFARLLLDPLADFSLDIGF